MDFLHRMEEGFHAEPPSIEIRLTVPSNGRKLESIQTEVALQLEQTGATVSSLPLPFLPSAQAMYEDEILEASFPVRFGQPQNTVRDASIQFARDFCQTVGHGLHEAVRMELISPDAYFLRCKSYHAGVRADAFSLGSFRNCGVFEDHYESIGGEWTIIMDYLHDVKVLELYRLVPHLERMDQRSRDSRYQSQGPQNSNLSIYRLNIPYASIHSIVIDHAGQSPQFADDQQPRVASVLYFRLKNPPKIERARVWTMQNCDATQLTADDLMEVCNNRRTYRYERQRNLSDCDWTVIGKCNVIKIVLWKDFSHRLPEERRRDLDQKYHLWINEIFSRLRTRANCRVYYAGIRNMRGAPSDPLTIDQYPTSFKCFYLLKALTSTRTYTIEDQANGNFLTYVKHCVEQNERAAEIALSQLLAAVDENKYFGLLSAFRKLFEVYANRVSELSRVQQPPEKVAVPLVAGDGASASVLLEDEPIAENCIHVRKLVVTPTREMLLAPESIVSNRVLRRFGEEYALRVVIRDEDGQHIPAGRMMNDVLGRWLRSLMTRDYVIGDRHYRFLGWSNSQLRDHGFYMFARTPDGSDVRTIRTWMGDFTAIQNVPKLMARMGQCFTQARTSLELPWAEGRVAQEADIMGGDSSANNGEDYCFSDGIGRISLEGATKICGLLDVTPVRSAYQIRYAGFKGMLSVDKRLDDPKLNPTSKMVILRESMRKFHSDTSHTLEIVKYSGPTSVTLNRPLVMILDQVSAHPLKVRSIRAPVPAGRSENVHRRVCDRIHELLDDELFTMADMLLDEKASAAALTARTTSSIDFKQLKDAGFMLTTEPFFRGLLLAIHQYTIKQQLWKQKIEIPIDQGRTMYGVLDEANVLQYGQVFVQYSKDLSKPGEDLVIVNGWVMTTKNPCVVAGDVRLLQAVAVNVDALKHLYDVIVFPANGPRPHTDEMAGSDLDGDEYSVYWDPLLMFDEEQLQKPMHYHKSVPIDVQGGVTDEHMVEFFARFLQQDSIGRLSNAHLTAADSIGIFSDRCKSIATKCAMAVDFSKTGIPADPLLPEEIAQKFPDFFEKYHRPMYRSARLVGQLYRRVKHASDIIRLGQDSVAHPSAVTTRHAFDQDLLVEGWKRYKDDAIRLRDQYAQYLQGLLDQYGVSDESSLLSGHMVTVRNRLSDREKEDFSFYNTEKMIEWRLTHLVRKFRRAFFDDRTGREDEDINDQMQQKASAWYWATYDPEEQRNLRGRIMLSFPWMVWEVLRYIKAGVMFNKYGRALDNRVIDPTAEALAKAIEEYCRSNPDEIARYITMIEEAERADPRSENLIQFYLGKYNPDFGRLTAVLLHWADKEIGFAKANSMKPIDLVRLLVDFLTDKSHLERRSVLEFKEREEGARIWHLTSIGDRLLEFLKYLASFKHREYLTRKICEDETTVHLRRRQLWAIGQVAFKAYHHVAWTNRFTSLHLENERRQGLAALAWDHQETEQAVLIVLEQRVIRRVPLERIHSRLMDWSGVDEIRIRETGYGHDEYRVLASGRTEARQALHSICSLGNLDEYLLSNSNPLEQMDL